MSDAPERIWAWLSEDGHTGELLQVWSGQNQPYLSGAAEYVRADLAAPSWQPIETAPKEERATFLVFDGVGVWKAWRLDGEIFGFEVDGFDLPSDGSPPMRWMPLPEPPDAD